MSLDAYLAQVIHAALTASLGDGSASTAEFKALAELNDGRPAQQVAQLAAPRFSTFSSVVVACLSISLHTPTIPTPRSPETTNNWTVQQVGSEPIWGRIEEALLSWRTAGKPAIDQFTITVTLGEQRAHLSGGKSWVLPAQ